MGESRGGGGGGGRAGGGSIGISFGSCSWGQQFRLGIKEVVILEQDTLSAAYIYLFNPGRQEIVPI